MNQFYNNWEQNRKQQNNLNNWDTQWNYYEQENKKQTPQKQFDMNEFMKTDWFNQNDTRADGKPKWDTEVGSVNTNYKFTNKERIAYPVGMSYQLIIS